MKLNEISSAAYHPKHCLPTANLQHEIEWLKREIDKLLARKEFTPRVQKQIDEYRRQIRHKEITIALAEPMKEGEVIPFRPRKKEEKKETGPRKCPDCGREMSPAYDTQSKTTKYICVDCLTVREDFVGKTLQETFDFKTLKKRKIKLEPEERDEAMKAKAVWHPSHSDKPVCAIWKSKKANGEVVYGANTHRVFQVAPSLKGAIKLFHDVVKGTA